MANETQGMPAAEPAEVDLLTLAETTEFLGISKQTLYRMMERMDIRGIKVGRQWRFRKGDLTAFLQRGPQASVLVNASPDAVDEELAFFAGELAKLGETSALADTAAPMTGDDALDLAEGKIVKLAGQMFALAIRSGASDIHLEAERQAARLRIRIDGVLCEVRKLPRDVYDALAVRLKTMANMNLEERRLPQDGRIQLDIGGRKFDMRQSLVPSIFGESFVIRILDQTSVLIGLERLGILPDDQERLLRLLHLPQGLVIGTGPTGSGKTTTMYSALNALNRPELKILTIEDPVEYAMPGLTQVAVNARAGLTFTTGMRSFLRQDPDILFAGEVRDRDTLEIAIQAALTGHLMLTTLHTEDAVSVLQRMEDIGIEPFLITAALAGVVAQRLARKLCEHCKAPMAMPPAARARIVELAARGGYAVPKDAVFYQAVGCEQCAQRGFRGRTGLFEVMDFTPALREAFLVKAPKADLVALAVQGGMHTLVADGIRKAAAGVTTLEEVLRVAPTQ